MRSNYKRLGDFIEEINIRNRDLEVDLLLGVSIRKVLMPSIANTIGSDMSKYKIISKNQFAYGPITSRNGDKISIALLQGYEKALLSQAYKVFQIIDSTQLLPEYLMMWFRRPEFDRYARYMSHGSTREAFDWQELCEVELPVPSLEKQQEIVADYNTVQDRIRINEQLNTALEETAQALYKHWFVDFEFPTSAAQAAQIGNLSLERQPYKTSGGAMVFNEELDLEIPLGGWEVRSLEDLTINITDGKHGNCINQAESGFYFVSVKDINNGWIYYDEARQITEDDFQETHRRTSLETDDILITNSGTIGKMVLVRDLFETKRTTFQKSVAIIKPNQEKANSIFLFSQLKNDIKRIREMAGGSTQSNLLLGDLRELQVMICEKELMQSYVKIVLPLFDKITNSHLQIKELNKLSEFLLSKMATVVDGEKLKQPVV